MTMTRPAVFCDFDGTIAVRDVGYSIFHRFSGGRNLALLPDWKAGRMSSREILRREAAMAPVTESELLEFLEDFTLDPGFAAFADRCHRQKIDLVVVSDGLDLYINLLLARNRLSHLPLIANHGYVRDGHIEIEFPFDNRDCARCGSCKGERIREYRLSHPGAGPAVFVGDGFSDACAAHEADLLFAKKDLERYCRMHNIPFVPYQDFFDVARELERRELLSRNDV